MRFFSRRRIYDDLTEEIQQHLEERVESLMADGMSREDAEHEARREFGNVTLMEERGREGWQWPTLESIWADIRFAVRQLRKSPGFALTVVITLTLGIGANTAIFSAVDAVLLRPLPYRHADRLVVVWQTDAAHRATGAWFDSYREFEEWQRGSRSFEHLAALSWAVSGKTVRWHGKPLGLLAIPASVNFFQMLGVDAQLGRTFSDSDLKSSCTLVLAHSFWQDNLGAPTDIVGSNVSVDHDACTVIGVMPKGFSFYPVATNAWQLITPTGDYARAPWKSVVGVFGLLRPGVSPAAAEAELASMENRILSEDPELKALGVSTPVAVNLQSNFTWLAGRNLRTTLWVLLGAVGLILLMACVNVANLLLGRTIERSREMAIRAALGSGRAPLIRQMLTESLLLSLCGAGAGILLAEWILKWFRLAKPVELPPGNVAGLHWQVFLFAAVAGIGSAVVFGLLPAWRGSRVDLNAALKTGERMGFAASEHKLSRVLAIVQVSLSLVLLVNAGLLIRSLWALASTPLGYRTDHLLTGHIDLPHDRYPTQETRTRLYRNLADKVDEIVGVESIAGASNFAPMGPNLMSIEGDQGKDAQQGSDVATQSVSADFFSTMQIPILSGRSFDTSDREDTRPVAIVNAALAQKYFPHQDPIGRSIKLGRSDDTWMRIVGVVGNVKTTTVFQEMGYVVDPAVYQPLTQSAPSSLAVVIATRSDPMQMESAIQQRLAKMDDDLLMTGVESMQRKQDAVLSPPRFRAVLFGSFAALALGLAVLGIYGLLTQFVAQRTRDIAIRMALGADRAKVLTNVLCECALLAAIGIGVGFAGSLVAVRALSGLLYGIHAENAALFVIAAGILLLATLVAGWRPARRAASIDPMVALRSE